MAAAGSRPVVSRRREVSGGSARSLLTTVLGEFVLPSGTPVWTATLVDVLGLFGVEEKAARQALARTAAEGWLSSDRVGRRVRWSLTRPGRRLLAEGAERIYGFGSSGRPWDGRWLVLLVSVPETMRDLRHKLRTRLSWAGFGSPTAGVWITPHLGAESDAKLILDELDLSGQAMSFLANYGALGQERDMVASAWNLTEVSERYDTFVAEFAALAPDSPDAVLRAQTLLVHEWRRFPFLDPQLPPDLLPTQWPGTTAATLFNEKHHDWRTRAQTRWTELASA
ncbi:PaaX family transcriptional regulator C-terminal domain-containing protein [Actinophytocola sp.]|jgi:phenylacetic acid degradation operon negative regulatory protein|uniref:PaaX family transcriptional regulator n=1 Tax=Actinophytocola sp. TaxID=1872138 RepID=UPI002EDA5C40